MTGNSDDTIVVRRSPARFGVRFIAAAGPSVRLELEREDTGRTLDAEISRERYRELELGIGDKVGVTPRNLRVFAPGPDGK